MSVPSRLGRYPVRRRIGSGAFATVWLAYDEQLDSPVAIKVLADNWTEDLHARQRFIEEGRFLRKVESPHVVSVYDAGELSDSRPFLVMSYADQGSLADRLELEPLTVPQVLHVIGEVGAGLHALHQRGVMHRDVKPANVLFRTVERDGEPRVSAMLGDLGLGKAMDMSSRLTMIGGTPSFAAPEQARGEALDARADQFSLAALAYLLLAGRAPYAHASLSAAADPGPPPPLEAGLPDEAATVLVQALSKDRDERYVDVPAFVAALTESLAGRGEEPPTWIPVVPELTRAGERPGSSEAPVTELGSRPVPKAAGLSRSRQALVGVGAVVVGLVAGCTARGVVVTQTTLRTDSGTLTVTVPEGWTKVVDTDNWTPPDAVLKESAISAGTEAGWNEKDGRGEGVFLGLLRNETLPKAVPGHPECTTPRPPDRGVRDGDPYMFAVFEDCPGGGVTIERIVQVNANRLLWIQVRAADQGTANDVIGSIATDGL